MLRALPSFTGALAPGVVAIRTTFMPLRGTVPWIVPVLVTLGTKVALPLPPAADAPLASAAREAMARASAVMPRARRAESRGERRRAGKFFSIRGVGERGGAGAT